MKVDKLKYIGLTFIINLHVSELAYTNDIEGRMKDLLETAAVGMPTNVLKTKVMSALTPHEQRHDVLLGGEPLEGVDTFNYPNSTLIANCQGC